ncbi:MAG: hypothetical protein L0213_07290, partial [Candidatus Dadabacteria bacterium]|nr:hypothetical protein [Candidatus Dadabacteria bacterium]
MANLQFSADILSDILFRAGEKTDGTSDYAAQALVYLNRAYRALYMGGGEFSNDSREQWYWMEESDSGVGVIEAVIRTGTVTVTRGSTAITFSSAPAVSVADYRFRVDGDEDMYRVASHTAASTAATLAVEYTGETGAGKNFRLMKFEYPLPAAAIRVVSPIYFYQDGGRECLLVDLDDITKHWVSGADLDGVPERFAMDKENQIVFDRYGSDTEGEKMVYELRYKTRPSDLTNSGSE